MTIAVIAVLLVVYANSAAANEAARAEFESDGYHGAARAMPMPGVDEFESEDEWRERAEAWYEGVVAWHREAAHWHEGTVGAARQLSLSARGAVRGGESLSLLDKVDALFADPSRGAVADAFRGAAAAAARGGAGRQASKLELLQQMADALDEANPAPREACEQREGRDDDREADGSEEEDALDDYAYAAGADMEDMDD